MSIRTWEDKHCDPEARFTAEFRLPMDFGRAIVGRSVTSVDISVFAPTRAEAKKKLRLLLAQLAEEMKK